MKKLFSLVLITLVAIGFTKAQVDTIYSQTFANGIPAGWANYGTSAGSANPWVKWAYTTVGCHDAYDNGVKITSPTAANGFLLFDSDSLDNGAVAGAFGDGPAPAPQIVTLTTTAIKTAGTPYCRLQFYQLFRNLESTTIVGISTDSFNWAYDTINTTVLINDQTSNPNKVIIDLTPYIAAGAPTDSVYISFIMNPAYYYFWEIDDILITSLPDYDLQVNQNFAEKGTSGLFYGSIPLSQFTSTDSFQALAEYTNTGSVTQTNINTNFKVIQGTAAVDSALGYPAVGSLAYGDDTTVTPARQFGTNGIAKYTVAVDVISSDSANFDAGANLDSIYFSVTDTVFSNSTSLGLGEGGYYLSESNEGVSFTLGNLYEITDQDTVTSVTTALLGGTGNTAAGTIIQASIYPVTLSSSVSYDATQPQVVTYPKTLTAANLTQANATDVTPITLQINFASGSAILTPGVYWVAISSTYSPDSDVVLATTTSSQLGSLAAAPDPTTANTLDPFNVSVPYVNLNLGHVASLLYDSWTRNPATTPVSTGQNITFRASSDGDVNSVYTWTFYSDSINPPTPYLLYSDTGGQVINSFPPSGSYSGKDIIEVCVTVTDGGASAQYCNTVEVKTATGISVVAPLTDVTLVPNPTTGSVNISADGINGSVSVSVVNMLGQIVKTFDGEANGSFSGTYDLSALSNGIYLVRIDNNGAEVTKKLSVSK